MQLSKVLQREGQPILQAILEHPFVQGIANGDLPREALIFYVGQDFNYLNAFLKVYAAAIQKCQQRDDMAIFAQQIDFILESEIHPHHNFCQVAGVSYESRQHDRQAPITYLYNEHMYHAARTGDLIDIAGALLPCPWTYLEIGDTLVRQQKNRPDNPFKDWIDFYANRHLLTIDQVLFNLVDREASRYDQAHLDRVVEAFVRSCELEWDFWEQAYHQQDWQFAPAALVTQDQEP